MSNYKTNLLDLRCMDCMELLKDLPDNSVDSIVSDPPYGLSNQPDMMEVLRHWMAGDDYKHKGKSASLASIGLDKSHIFPAFFRVWKKHASIVESHTTSKNQGPRLQSFARQSAGRIQGERKKPEPAKTAGSPFWRHHQGRSLGEQCIAQDPVSMKRLRLRQEKPKPSKQNAFAAVAKSLPMRLLLNTRRAQGNIVLGNAETPAGSAKTILNTLTGFHKKREDQIGSRNEDRQSSVTMPPVNAVGVKQQTFITFGLTGFLLPTLRQIASKTLSAFASPATERQTLKFSEMEPEYFEIAKARINAAIERIKTETKQTTLAL